MGVSQYRPVVAGFARVSALGGLCLVLANCTQTGPFARKVDPKYGVSPSERVVAFGDPVPKGGGKYRVGKPYVVAGRIYTPEEDTSYAAEGLASWYGDDFHGRRTANGELFDMESLSAAHPTLPLPSYVRVTNLGNRKSVIVRVNDRGPYHANRLIDVSRKAATLLGFHSRGVAKVRVEYVGQASLAGSDDRLLEATLREGVPAPLPSVVRVASARPFLPARGEVPLPESRPYTLGEDVPAADVPQRSAAPATVATVRQTRVAAQAAATAPRKVQTESVHVARTQLAQAPAARPPSPARAQQPAELASAAPARAVSTASADDEHARLMPRSLGEQAQELSRGGFAQRYPAGSPGLQQTPAGLPGAMTAYAPVRGLY